MVTYVILRHPVTILVTDFTNPDNLIAPIFVYIEMLTLQSYKSRSVCFLVLVVSIDLFSVFFMPFSYNEVYFQCSNPLPPPPPPTFVLLSTQTVKLMKWLCSHCQMNVRTMLPDGSDLVAEDMNN